MGTTDGRFTKTTQQLLFELPKAGRSGTKGQSSPRLNSFVPRDDASTGCARGGSRHASEPPADFAPRRENAKETSIWHSECITLSSSAVTNPKRHNRPEIMPEKAQFTRMRGRVTLLGALWVPTCWALSGLMVSTAQAERPRAEVRLTPPGRDLGFDLGPELDATALVTVGPEDALEHAPAEDIEVAFYGKLIQQAITQSGRKGAAEVGEVMIKMSPQTRAILGRRAASAPSLNKLSTVRPLSSGVSWALGLLLLETVSGYQAYEVRSTDGESVRLESLLHGNKIRITGPGGVFFGADFDRGLSSDGHDVYSVPDRETGESIVLAENFDGAWLVAGTRAAGWPAPATASPEEGSPAWEVVATGGSDHNGMPKIVKGGAWDPAVEDPVYDASGNIVGYRDKNTNTVSAMSSLERGTGVTTPTSAKRAEYRTRDEVRARLAELGPYLPADELDRLVDALEEDGFDAARNLVDYDSEVKGKLWPILASLGPDARVLDAGSGLLHAAEAYLRDFAGDFVALSFRDPNKGGRMPSRLARVYGPRFQHRVGRFIEDYSAEELGEFDVVMDILGPGAYSLRPDSVFKLYGEILKPGGRAILNIGTLALAFEGQSTKDGLEAWLLGSGFQIEYNDGQVVILQRTHDPLKIRPLDVIEYLRGSRNRPYSGKTVRIVATP